MAAVLYSSLVIVTFTGIALNEAAKWSYFGESGTSKWHELFPEACSGKHQSPIDIRPEETTYNPHLKNFAIWYDPPKPDSKMYIKNNGHTVQVDLEGEFFVTNGGLSHVYKALQFHFHWGSKSHHGSEHVFDGKASPIEMHLVTYNQELYSDIGKAVVTKGGLAVLGVMSYIGNSSLFKCEVRDTISSTNTRKVFILHHDRNIDQVKAFDRANRYRLWEVMESYDVEGQLLDDIHAFYAKHEGAVQMNTGQISDEDNPSLATIVRALKYVRDPDLHEKVALPLMSLRDFLPGDISRYYRYNGSLTTPGCFESVIWTVFDEKQTISLAQLQQFTTLLQYKHFHKKMKKSGHAGSRHQRSLNNADQKFEHRAEEVLYELGIKEVKNGNVKVHRNLVERDLMDVAKDDYPKAVVTKFISDGEGNKFQETVLRSELMHMQMMGDTPQDDNVVVDKIEKQKEDMDTHETDDDHENEGKFSNDQDNDKRAENGGAINDERDDATNNDDHETDEHATDHKSEEQVEGGDTYTQEDMVDNFRPIQPLNDRVVYRSFKLRGTAPIVDVYVEEKFVSPHKAESSGKDNGAKHLKLSLPAIVLVLILTVLCM